jgi:hypothetical protein
MKRIIWFICFVFLLYYCKSDNNDNVKQTIKYYKSGEIQSIFYYDTQTNDSLVTYYIDGKKESYQEIVNKKNTGKTIWYYPDGKIKSMINYKNDKKNGKRVDYFENGKVNKEANFIILENEEYLNTLITMSETGDTIFDKTFVGNIKLVKDTVSINDSVALQCSAILRPKSKLLFYFSDTLSFLKKDIELYKPIQMKNYYYHPQKVGINHIYVVINFIYSKNVDGSYNGNTSYFEDSIFVQ